MNSRRLEKIMTIDLLNPHPSWLAVFLAMIPLQGVSGTVMEPGDFAGYSAVSDQELAALRGGFEMYIGGQLLSLAFSLERVSYLNGELLTLTRIEVPDIAAAIKSPGTVSVSTYAAPPASGEAAGIPANLSPEAVPGSSYSPVAPPVSAEAAGITVNPSPQIATVSLPGQYAGSYVTLIQNGAGNSAALPVQVDQQVSQALQAAQAQILQAYNHVQIIRNSLDNQVIQNTTTLNVTLSNEALARAVELNAGLANLLNAPLVVRH